VLCKGKGSKKEVVYKILLNYSGKRQELLVVSNKLISGWTLEKNRNFSEKFF
jgi:hypothetical protein